jgi:hypothetical protein
VQPVEAVSEWDHGGASGERIARLAADQDLVWQAQLERFAGPVWEQLSTALAEYGYAVMDAWIRTGKVFRHCREKNIKVGRPPEDGFGHADVEELMTATVGDALTTFRNVLATGRWDPTKGATLTTFFIGQCLIQFPTVYQNWSRTIKRDIDLHAALAASPPNLEHLDPAATFELNADAAELLNQISDPLTREIVRLKLDGWSQAEISEALGISAGVIEGRLYRLRRKGIR